MEGDSEEFPLLSLLSASSMTPSWWLSGFCQVPQRGTRAQPLPPQIDSLPRVPGLMSFSSTQQPLQMETVWHHYNLALSPHITFSSVPSPFPCLTRTPTSRCRAHSDSGRSHVEIPIMFTSAKSLIVNQVTALSDSPIEILTPKVIV